jgi:hypothetical protein
MKRLVMIATLCALPLFGNAISSPALAGETLMLAGNCAQRMGPFTSQYAAQVQQQAYQARGYSTSGVWGEGGVVSSWSNRRYFFNVFYPC